MYQHNHRLDLDSVVVLQAMRRAREREAQHEAEARDLTWRVVAWITALVLCSLFWIGIALWVLG